MAVLPTFASRVRLALRYIRRTLYSQSVTITVGPHKNTDTSAGRCILRTLVLFVFHPHDGASVLACAYQLKVRSQNPKDFEHWFSQRLGKIRNVFIKQHQRGRWRYHWGKKSLFKNSNYISHYLFPSLSSNNN